MVDPDVDLHDQQQRGELARSRPRLLAAIACGGVLGAAARALLTERGVPLAGFPTATVLVNVAGSALIGVLMTWLGRGPARHWLLRPFLGVGVLGGFTTFSTYAVDAQALLVSDQVVVALATLVLTPVIAVGAAATSAAAARRALARRDRS